mgnify:CR=1 FL=1
MGKTVFVAPLDWGLGHATRCVPLIRSLIQAGHLVHFGVTETTKKILDEEFTHLNKYYLSETKIHYHKFLPAWFSILLQTPRLLTNIQREKKITKKIFDQINPDVVISDNRYGCYFPKAKNILITHQLKFKQTGLSFFSENIVNHLVKHFQEIWVPDFDNKTLNLSGELSRNKKFELTTKFIGPLSRLEPSTINQEKKYSFCFLISGPESLRSIFEKEAVAFVKNSNEKCAIVRGSSLHHKIIETTLNCDVFDLPDRKKLEHIISVSETIVCRSGYSSIMDIVKMKKAAFIYPTPGQSEQLYLAKYNSKHRMFKMINKI